MLSLASYHSCMHDLNIESSSLLCYRNIVHDMSDKMLMILCFIVFQKIFRPTLENLSKYILKNRSSERAFHFYLSKVMYII